MQQGDVIDFLSKPDTYGLNSQEKVERVDTHISIVFLAGPYAYKLKRATVLSFVDFRKLEDRYTNCKRELEVNAYGAPGLYLDVVPVTLDEGRLVLEGQGEAVEWLVKMERFDQNQLFDRLSERGELDYKLMERLCDHICACYKKAPINHEYGGYEGIKRAFEGHYRAFASCPEHVIERAKVIELKGLVDRAASTFRSVLKDRSDVGFVRQCHGDLHLRNICFHNEQIKLFDAIEFEPDFAIIDVVYDLAFLLMDLCHRDQVDLANAVMNRYLGITGDVAALNLMGLFMASRAAIRAHVNGIASQNQANSDAQHSLEQESKSYLNEAIEFMGRSEPKLIAIGGFSGSGKSKVSRMLAPTLGVKPGAYVARTDMIRKRIMGVDPQERLTAYAYEESVTRHTYNTLFVEIQFALCAGYSVIADGVFAKEEERRKLKILADKLGIEFKGFWLDAPSDVLMDRVDARKGDVSDADRSVVELQMGYEVGHVEWQKVDAVAPVEGVLKEIKKHLSKY